MRGLVLAALLLALPALAETPSMVPMMGKRLFAPGGEELGRVVDLVCDPAGKPIAAVVDVGGFMGLGSRRVALAWPLLHFTPEAEHVRLSVTLAPELVTAAPEYRPGDMATIYSPQGR